MYLTKVECAKEMKGTLSTPKLSWHGGVLHVEREATGLCISTKPGACQTSSRHLLSLPIWAHLGARRLPLQSGPCTHQN